jgi:hypothetical protein
MSFRTWSTLDVTITIILFFNEHCIILFEHVRQLRRHLERSQKTMLKTRVLKIFDCLKNLTFKLHVQSEISDRQRVLRKINHMHRDLTKIIFSLSTFKSDSASQKEELTTMMKIFAKNLSVMIKHCNKNVIKRLKNRTLTQIVAKTNTTIDRMKKELRKSANISNSSKNRVLIF